MTAEDPAAALAPLLGLNERDLLNVVSEGLPPELAEQMAAALHLTLAELLERIGVAERTKYRRLAGAPLSSVETERVLRIVDFYRAARARLGDHESVVSWICSPVRLERIAVGVNLATLQEELLLAASSETFLARLPRPKLPAGFSMTPWELDDTPGPPQTVPLRCGLSVETDDGTFTTAVRISPPIDSDRLTLRRLLYDQFEQAIRTLRRDSFVLE